MKLKIEIDGEVAELLRSIDTSLRLISNRSYKPLYNNVTGVNTDATLQAPPKMSKPNSVGIDRLSVSSPEEIARLELIDYCKEHNIILENEDIEVGAISREY